MAIVMALGVAAACSPQPGALVVPGGTYDLDLRLPPRHAAETFDLWIFGTCTLTVDTPEVRLEGATLTVGQGVVDQVAGTVTIPDGKVVVPRSTVPLGTISLHCDGQPVGSLSLTLEVEATASLRAVVYHPGDRILTLTDPTLTIPTVMLTVGGDVTLPPIDLGPITVAIPTVSTRV
jgi:hypothetical protein